MLLAEKVDKFLYNLRKKFPLLLRVNIEITRQCNFYCKHCYMSSTFVPDKNELKIEDYKKFAQDLLKIQKGLEVVFTGGEPLMKKGFSEILKYYHSLGFRCYLVTNGFFLNEKKFLEIQKYLQGIFISIDGLKEYHNKFRGFNSFDIIMKNIEYISHNSDMDLGIKTTFTKENIGDIEKIYNLLKEKGIKKWHIIIVSSRGRGEKIKNLLDNDDVILINSFIEKTDDMEIFFDNPLKKKLKKCLCGIQEFVIYYNGDITGCLNHNKKTAKINGNIKKEDIVKIWNKSFLEYRNKKFYNCDK